MTTQTSPQPDQLDAFETRLLSELRREVSDQPISAPSSDHGRRRVVLLASAAAAAVAAVVVVPGLGTAPAYSVSEGNSGEVHVEINRPEDAAGLERALAEHGITADVTYLTDLARCAPGRYEPVGRDVGITLSMSEQDVTVTLAPGAVREDETFVMVWSVEPLSEKEMTPDTAEGVPAVSGFASSVDADVTADRVLPCRVVPAPTN